MGLKIIPNWNFCYSISADRYRPEVSGQMVSARGLVFELLGGILRRANHLRRSSCLRPVGRLPLHEKESKRSGAKESNRPVQGVEQAYSSLIACVPVQAPSSGLSTSGWTVSCFAGVAPSFCRGSKTQDLEGPAGGIGFILPRSRIFMA